MRPICDVYFAPCRSSIIGLLLAPRPRTNLPFESVSTVAAPMATSAGEREYTLIIEDPILGLKAFCDTAAVIAKFSIPHVSGIHIVSGL